MELKSNVEVPFEAADGKERMKERMKKCDYINNNQNKIAQKSGNMTTIRHYKCKK